MIILSALLSLSLATNDPITAARFSITIDGYEVAHRAIKVEALALKFKVAVTLPVEDAEPFVEQVLAAKVVQVTQSAAGKEINVYTIELTNATVCSINEVGDEAVITLAER